VAAVDAAVVPIENPGTFVEALIRAAVHLEKHLDHCRLHRLQIHPDVVSKRAELHSKLGTLLAPGMSPFDKLQNTQLGQLNSALIKLGVGCASQAVSEELKERARRLAALPITGRS
jgi:hypothetical protein